MLKNLKKVLFIERALKDWLQKNFKRGCDEESFQIIKALEKKDVIISLKTLNHDENYKLVPYLFKRIKADIVFAPFYINSKQEWIFDFLDKHNIPHVFASKKIMSSFQNKVEVNKILVKNNLSKIQFIEFDGDNSLELKEFIEKQKKIIIKPIFYNQSFDSKIFDRYQKALTYAKKMIYKTNNSVLVEKFIENRKEYQVAMFGNNSDRFFISFLLSIPNNDILTNKVKKSGKINRLNVDKNKEKKLVDLTKKVIDLFSIKDFVRVEIQEDENNNLFLVDINGIPDMKNSQFLADCIKYNKNYTYENLIYKIVESAYIRNLKK